MIQHISLYSITHSGGTTNTTKVSEPPGHDGLIVNGKQGLYYVIAASTALHISQARTRYLPQTYRTVQ
jgi:hypothetical protein